MKSRWWKPGHHDNDGAGNFELLLKIFQEIRLESVNYLLDIEAYLSNLLTTLRITSFSSQSTLSCAQDRVARKYITAMLQNILLRRKITFTSQEERKSAAVLIRSSGLET